MKSLKRIIPVIISVILSFTMIIPCMAENYDYDYDFDDYYDEEDDASLYSNEPYVLSDYSVDIKVGKDNVLDITENITADFREPRHGIIRSIPIFNKIIRDNSTSVNNVEITNVSCSDNYTVSYENQNMKMKIGDADQTITGYHDYTIHYKYNLGKDTLEGNDEFYFNIIGTEWDAPILSADFIIEFPNDFDPETVGLSCGSKFTWGDSTDRVTWENSGNIISGFTNEPLEAGEGISVRAVLPEGYFSEAKMIFDYSSIISAAAVLIGSILCILIYMYSRKKNYHVSSVQFYPPNGINSLELALIRYGKVTKQNVVSLLPYLASKGYIDIIEKYQNNYDFVKKRVYDGSQWEEKHFIDGMFSYKDMVNQSYLKNRFYRYVNEITSYFKSKEKRSKYFKKSFMTLKNFYILLIVLTTVCSLFLPMLISKNTDKGLAFSLIIFLSIFGTFFISLAFNAVRNIKSGINSNSIVSLIMLIFFILFFIPSILISFASVLFSSLLSSQKAAFLFAAIVIVLLIILYNYIDDVRNDEGLEMLGKVEGFEEFIKTAEKDRLEALANENPSYFYDIMPYAYVLGISNVWVKKFEGLAVPPPQWYSGNNSFNYMAINSMMNSCSQTMNSAPSWSGSGGGGGGCSGGGSGGGGGSSW